MNRKRMLRRTVAGMLAVLVVSGNILLPSQTVKLVADNAIVADASEVTGGNYTWDASTGTLTITGTVNMEHDASDDVDEVLTAYDHKNWIGTRQDVVDKKKVKHLVIASTAVLPENCQAMFKGYNNLEDVVFAEYVDGTNVRKMSAMFKNCSKLKSVDMSGLINTQNLEYIDNIFDGCSSLKSLDISNIDGSKICQGRWESGSSWGTTLYHPAIDAIKEAIKNCNALTDFEISSEFLDHCVINARNNTSNTSNQNVTIEDVLESLLKGNPHKEDFKQALLNQYNEWKESQRIDIKDFAVNGTENLVYDGNAFPRLTITGLTEGTDYTLTLKREGLTAVTELKDAGIYSYTFEGIGNYRGKITGNVTVNPRVAELFWSNLEFTYKNNQTKFCPTATVGNLVDGDECTVTVSGASAQAGTHEARATALSNVNYALPSNPTHTFTIYSAALTGVTSEGYEGVYDGTAHGITVNSVEDDVEITYGLNTNVDAYTAEQPELKDAGTYTVYYRVKKENHTEVTGSETVKINPAEAGVEWSSDTSFVYNGSAQAPAATATGLIEGDESEVVIEGAGTDVGSYTATATGFTNTNYILPAVSTQDFDITPADQDGITAEGYSGEYDGQAHTITVDAPDGATVTYSETEEGEYTAEAPSLTDAGTKTVYYKVTNAPNYKDASGSADIEITAKAIGLTWGETEFDYDGETHCPTAEATDLIGDDECIVTVSGAASDAGTHTATASSTNTNYVLPEDIATTEFTIKAATMTAEAEDVSFEYDNKPHTITVDAPDGATILYSETEDGEFTAEAPSITAADSKTVYYKVTKPNFEDVTGSATVTVTKRTAVIAWEDTSFTYDGSEKCPKATVSNIAENDTCEVTVSGGATDAGSYTAKAESLSNENYILPDGTETDFTIANASFGENDYVINNYSGTYDKNAHSMTVTAPEGATVTYSYNGGAYTAEAPSFTDAGVYEVNFKIEKANFETVEGFGIVSITQAELELEVTMEGWTYGETAKTPSVTGNEGLDYTIEYSKDGVTWSETVPTEGGTYTVKAYVAASQNYYEATATDSFDIAPADLALKVEMDGWKYGDDASDPVVSGNNDLPYTIEYSVKGEENWTSDKPENAGNYVVKAYVEGNDNYNEAEATAEFEIERGDLVVKIAVESWTYGEEPNAPVVTGNKDIPYIIEYEKVGGVWTTDVPTEAGSYYARVTVEQSDNYYSASHFTPFSIFKADVSISVSMEDWTYGEAAKEPVIKTTPEGLDYTVEYFDAEGYAVDNPVDAGDYFIRVTVAESANYNGNVEGDEFSILSGQLSVTAEGFEGEYDGQEHGLSFTGLPDGAVVEYAVEDGEYTSEAPSFKDAGTYVVNYKITVDNYEVLEGSAEIDIDQRTAVLEWTPKSFDYDGQPHCPTATVKNLVDGDTCTVEVGNNYMTEAGGYYNATAISLSNDNYKLPENAEPFKWSIEPGTLIVSAEDITVDYDPDKSYSITVIASEPDVTIQYRLVEESELSSENPSFTDAGTYQVIYEVSKENYVSEDGVAIITINKVAREFSVSLDDWTYGTDAKTPVLTGAENATYEYSVKGSDEWTTEVPVNAGDYVVRATAAGDKNYNDTTAEDEFSILKADRQISVSLDDWTYGTDAKTPVLTGAENATYEYSVKGSDEWTTEVPVNAGDYVVRATAAGNNNYYEATAEDEFSINKADREITVSISNWREGEEPKQPQLTGADEAVFYYSPANAEDWTEEVPFDAGAYKIKAVVAGDENYNEATDEANFVITDAHFIHGNTVSFSDYISLNFLAEISEGIREGSYVIFTYDHYGETVTKRVDISEKDKNGIYFRFRCPLSAAEMAIDVQADLYLANSGEPVDSWTRNIRDFSMAAIEDNGRDKDLIVAALNYGGYTQAYFKQNTEVIANEGIETNLADVTVTSEVDFVRPEGFVNGIQYVGSTLLLKDSPYIRYYFKLDPSITEEDAINGYTFMIDGVAYEAAAKGSMYYIESKPEHAFELDKAQTIEVQKGDETVFSFDYSVIKWAEIAASEPASDAELDMAKGLYAYYQAAKAYVGKP